MTAPIPAETRRVLCRFATLGGAVVVVVRLATAPSYYEEDEGTRDCTWQCLGCDDVFASGLLRAETAKERANRHAAGCRSMPLDDAAPAVALADVAAQLRGLNITAAEAGVAVVDGVRALAELAEVASDDRDVLGDIALAVESLAASLERPRRRWLRRWRSAAVDEHGAEGVRS